jgi:hypothetical protein
MRPADMRPADMRAANMRRPEPTAAASAEAYSAAVPAKPAAMSAKTCEVSAATVSAAAMSASTATMPAASAAAGVCLECEKRYDEEQHRGNASAGRQHQLHGPAGLGAPHRCGRQSLGILPRTKSL